MRRGKPDRTAGLARHSGVHAALPAPRGGGYSAARGFTLLEVLVALLLLSLALVAAIRAAGLEARALGQQREATLATWVAANVLADTRLNRSAPADGRADGRAELGGRRWRWQLDTEATDEPGLLRLEVRVHADAADAAEPAARLIGFYRL